MNASDLNVACEVCALHCIFRVICGHEMCYSINHADQNYLFLRNLLEWL